MEDMGNSKLFAMDIEFPDGTKVSMKKGPTDVAVSSNNSNIKIGCLGDSMTEGSGTTKIYYEWFKVSLTRI